MSQDFAVIAGNEYIKDSRPKINNNFEALRSGFQGSAFPTEPAPVEGQRCFNGGIWYTYHGTEWVVDEALHDHEETSHNEFSIGDGLDTDKKISVNNGDTNKPAIRYNATTNKWQYTNDGNAWLDIGSGGGSTKEISMTAHGFSVGNNIRQNGTTYVLAQADTEENAEVFGIVSEVVNANKFVLLSSGYVSGLTGLTAGAVHYLSPTVAGGLTVTEPTGENQISKPLFLADSATSGFFYNMRGVALSGLYSIYGVFDSASLVDGVLTIPHNFGHKYCEVLIVDNNDKKIIPDDVLYYSTTQVKVDLSSFGTISGAWRYYVMDNGSVYSVGSNSVALDGLSGTADKLSYFTGAGAMALTDLTAFSRTVLAQSTAQLAKDKLVAGIHGQCRLQLYSATQLQLTPHNGDNLLINNLHTKIPSCALYLSNTGLSADTTYYIYAYRLTGIITHRSRSSNVVTLTTQAAHGLKVGDAVIVPDIGGTNYSGHMVVTAIPTTLTFSYAYTGSDESTTAVTPVGYIGVGLEASTTGYSYTTALNYDTTGWIYYKTGDATRAIVGMARTNSSSQFVDSQTQRYVRSWFNRKPLSMYTYLVSTTVIGAAPWTVLSTDTMISFLTLPGDALHAWASGSSTDSVGGVGQAHYQGIGVDSGSGVTGTTACRHIHTTGYLMNVTNLVFVTGLADGWHYARILVGISGGSNPYWAGGGYTAIGGAIIPFGN